MKGYVLRPWRLGALAAVLVAAVAIGATAASAGQTKAPYDQKFSWGTFKLSDRIAQKLKDKKSLNVVLSYIGQSVPVYSPEFKYGFAQGVKQAEKQYGLDLDGKLIGPVQANANEQISQIRSQLATNQIDCLAVESGGLPAFAPVLNQAIDAGVPVFTTNTDVAGSHRFGTFHTNWKQEGKLAADAVAAFFKSKRVTLKSAFMTTGAVDQVWAQDRMNGFMNELKKKIPGVTFTNTPKGALSTGFDAAGVYSQVRAYLQGHPDVQVVYQTDVGADALNKALTDLKVTGKTFSVGHNVSLETLNSIQKGVQIATLDQQFPVQAGWAAHACAAFLAKGKVLPNSNVPLVITKANVAKAKADFIRITK